jgi:hypothetical protein
MIAPGLTTGKAPPCHSGLLTHGRIRQSQPHKPQQPEPLAASQDLDIFDLARLRARDTNRVTFIISHWSNEHWNLVFADGFQVTEDDVIEYVVWPPQWTHQPTPGRLDWLCEWHSEPG